MKFKPTDQEVAELQIGKLVRLQVVAVAQDDRAQAVVVLGVRSANEVAHVTISTAEGTKPAYSNELLGRGTTPLPATFEIDGMIDTFPRSAQ